MATDVAYHHDVNVYEGIVVSVRCFGCSEPIAYCMPTVRRVQLCTCDPTNITESAGRAVILVCINGMKCGFMWASVGY